MVIEARTPTRSTPTHQRPTEVPWYRRLVGSSGSRPVPDVVDVGIAVASYGVFTLPVALGAADGRGSTAAIVVLGALAVVPLAVRRRWPAVVLVAITLVEVACSLLGVQFTPLVSNAGPVLGVAVFTVADRLPRRRSLTWSVTAVVATSVASLIALRLDPGQDQNAVQLAIAVPAWLLGNSIRTRREHRRRLDIEVRAQAAEREARIRAEERLHISRDVHDVLSHTLSMIAVRSGVARLLLDAQPQEASSALAAIETTSRSALVELRQVLQQTREGAGPSVATEPGLADVGTLIDGLRHDGMALDYRVTGEPVSRDDPVLEMSAYRIVQEAITNVVKHSQATRVRIELRHLPGQLKVTVLDDGPSRPGPADGTGLGLAGMRERVGLFDGTLHAGPRPEGGFVVEATFPLAGDDDAH